MGLFDGKYRKMLSELEVNKKYFNTMPKEKKEKLYNDYLFVSNLFNTKYDLLKRAYSDNQEGFSLTILVKNMDEYREKVKLINKYCSGSQPYTLEQYILLSDSDKLNLYVTAITKKREKETSDYLSSMSAVNNDFFASLENMTSKISKGNTIIYDEMESEAERRKQEEKEVNDYLSSMSAVNDDFSSSLENMTSKISSGTAKIFDELEVEAERRKQEEKERQESVLRFEKKKFELETSLYERVISFYCDLLETRLSESDVSVELKEKILNQSEGSIRRFVSVFRENNKDLDVIECQNRLFYLYDSVDLFNYILADDNDKKELEDKYIINFNIDTRKTR